MAKGVIFDWGGVLMRTVDYTYRHDWDRKLNHRPGYVESIVHGIPAWKQFQLGEIDEQAYRLALGEELKISEQQVTFLLADFYKGDELNQNLLTFLERINPEERILTAILSNNAPALRTEIEEMGLLYLFDAVVISAEIGVMKPDDAAYEAVLSKLGLEPEACIFVDDTSANVDAALILGMETIYATPGEDIIARIEAWLGRTNNA